MRNKSTAAFIDMGYLSFISKYLGKGKHLKYDVHEIAIELSKKVNFWCEDLYIFTAPPYQSNEPTEEEKRKKEGYDKMIKKVKAGKLTTWVREGRIQKTNEGFRQKGVDVLLTLDLMRVAQTRQFSKLILMTSDTDFVPVIDYIQQHYKTEIVLAYFTDKKRKSPFSLSNHLWQICKDKILVNKEYFYS